MTATFIDKQHEFEMYKRFKNFVRYVARKYCIYDTSKVIEKAFDVLREKKFPWKAAHRLLIYFLKYIREELEEDDNYKLAVALERMLRKQLTKIFSVSTHRYHKCACEIANKIFVKYSLLCRKLISRYIIYYCELIRDYDLLLRFKEQYIAYKNEIYCIHCISPECIYRHVNEFKQYVDDMRNVIKIALAIAESDESDKRSKNELLKLLSKVYDDLYNDVMHRTNDVKIIELFNRIESSIRLSSITRVIETFEVIK